MLSGNQTSTKAVQPEITWQDASSSSKFGPREVLPVSLRLAVRSLQPRDYHGRYREVLAQLTEVGDITEDFFRRRLEQCESDKNQYLLVVEDVDDQRIVGSGTVIIENKFIHQAGKVGHIEDVVVDKVVRGKGIGKTLVEQLQQQAFADGCYKVILDCMEHNVGFYEKCGFKRKELMLVHYFDSALVDSSETRISPEELNYRLAQTLKPQMVDGLLFRPLLKTDYHSNFMSLLSQLTEVGQISRKFFLQRLAEIEGNENQHMIVIEDLETSTLVAAGTLLVEPKFIHKAGLAGHIEDIVVNKEIRGKGLGKKLIEKLVDIAKCAGCYKVILDCAEHNVPFYNKCGFHAKEVCMACYLKDHPKFQPQASVQSKL